MCVPECVPMLSDVTFALSRGIVSTGANRTSGSPGHTGIPLYTGRVMSMTMVRICITIPGLYFHRASVIILLRSCVARGLASCSELTS